MATNFLRLFKAGSARLALVVGASGVGCGAGEGRIYTWSVEGTTGSGLLVAWAVAMGFNSMGNGFKTSSWGSSTISFPLPFSVIKGRISSFFSLRKTTTHVSEDSDKPLDISIWCGCC